MTAASEARPGGSSTVLKAGMWLLARFAGCGHAGRCPPLGIGGPVLGQVPAWAERPATARVGRGGRDHRPAVRQLARFAPGPALDAHRGLARLGPLGGSGPPHPGRRGGIARAHQQPRPARLQPVRSPPAGDRALPRLLRGGLGQHVRHPLGLLARQVRDRPRQLGRPVADAPRSREGRPQLLDEGFRRPTLDPTHADLHHLAPSHLRPAKITPEEC